MEKYFLSDHMNPFTFGDDTLPEIVEPNDKGENDDSCSNSSSDTTIHAERGYSQGEGIFRISRQHFSLRDRAHQSLSPHKNISYSSTHKDSASIDFGSFSFNKDQSQSTLRQNHRPDHSKSFPDYPGIAKSPSVDTISIVRKATFPFKPASDLEKFQAQTIRDSRSDINDTRLSPSFANQHSILHNGAREMHHVSYSPPRRAASFPCETSQQYVPSTFENHGPLYAPMIRSSESFSLNDFLQLSIQNPWSSGSRDSQTREEEGCTGKRDDKDELTSLFPVCIHLPFDKNCWWINDFDFSDNTSTIIYDQDDQVEVMHTLEPSVARMNEHNDKLQRSRRDTAAITVPDKQKTSSTSTRKDSGTSGVQGEELRQRFKLGFLDNFMETLSSEAGPCVMDVQDAIDSGIVTIAEVGNDFDNDDLGGEVFNPSEGYVNENSVENNDIKRDSISKADPVRTGETSAQFTSESDRSTSNEAFNQVRRTTVAITGATLVTTGIALIPFPVVPGALVAYGGLMVLATEFEGAKKALKVVKGPLERILADEIDSDEENDNRDSGASSSWQQTVSFLPCINQLFVQDIDDDFLELMNMGKCNSFHGNRDQLNRDGVCRFSKNELDKSRNDSKSAEARARKNAMKRWMRRFLKLESDVDSNQIVVNGIDDNAMTNEIGEDDIITYINEKRNKAIVRFDSDISVVTSCGEEVDENGVQSDRLQINEDGGILFSFRRTSSSDGLNKSFSRSDSLKIQKENPGCILFCRGNSDSCNTIVNGKKWTWASDDMFVNDEEVAFD